MPLPFIALLTDFGTRDPYVAQMKGVIASRVDATLVDLTHEIAPFDVFEAAMFLQACTDSLPAFPDRICVVVAVVDPGVGSPRRLLSVRSRQRLFLAPDNGLLPAALDRLDEVRSIESTRFFLPEVSSTFHGRDRFAPVAAALACGIAIEELGPAIRPETLVRLPYDPPSYGEASASGTVIAVDRFGNLVTDLELVRLGSLARFEAAIGRRWVRRTATHYAEVEDRREPFLISGSRGTVEISLRGGSAADLLQAGRFERVSLRLKS